MSDTPITDAACVSREYIEREMDIYTQQFVLAGYARKLERDNQRLSSALIEITESNYSSPERLREIAMLALTEKTK